jgi:adenine specific DNA methylase Mod
MTKEQKFYKALQDVFIGAKVEGQGGFINLMRIKSNYYSQIEKILMNDIEEALKQFPEFRDELFDKLYSFFSRYFSESGSIYFNSTPFHNNIYEKVYTDDKDVVLFWKTQMLYYVKTDRIFRSMPVEFDSFRFYFDASTIENKKANEKRSLIFKLKELKDETIVFSVFYSERGNKTKTTDIIRELKKNNITITEEELERAFRIFEKQSEVDFFINKNAKTFLQEQFKLWSYQYFWDGAQQWSAKRVNELQILKDIAFKVIDFVAQFENELVKIWNKPKFVKNSNYVITLDRIKDTALIKKILNHKNIKQQVKEWEELGFVDGKFKPLDVIASAAKQPKKLFDEETPINPKYQFLPIDTKYFKDLELEILSLFEDLDNSLDGWLIKSENYQALNTILPKFKEKIQTIYIDPPFNLDSSDQFLYRTNYKDANWATLLENRLRIAKNWLNEKGSIFVRCDYNGNWIVRCLMDEIFDNFKNEIILSKSAKLTEKINKYHSAHDSLYFYTKSEDYDFEPATKRRNEPKWRGMHLPGIRWSPIPNEFVKLFSKENLREKNGKFVTRARIILGKELLPPEGRHWALSQESIFELEKEGKIKFNEKGEPQTEEGEIQKLTDNWTDWVGYSSIWGFATENNERVLERVIRTSSLKKGDIILDFFLGSGTTTAVAHKLGRKWIGVEMGEHFYSVVLPRMKKVLAYDKSGISKEVKEYKGGGFFKYYELEQYEEALDKCKENYKNGDLFTVPGRSPYQEYVFLKDKKLLDALELDDKNKKVKVDLSKLYDNIDIAETLSNLTGKWIKKIIDDEVEFEDGTKINTKDLDYKLIKPLIWWE